MQGTNPNRSQRLPIPPTLRSPAACLETGFLDFTRLREDRCEGVDQLMRLRRDVEIPDRDPKRSDATCHITGPRGLYRGSNSKLLCPVASRSLRRISSSKRCGGGQSPKSWLSIGRGALQSLEQTACAFTRPAKRGAPEEVCNIRVCPGINKQQHSCRIIFSGCE